MYSHDDIHRDLLQRINDVRRKLHRAEFLRGALMTGSVVLASLLLAVGGEALAHGGTLLRGILFWFVVATALVAAIRFALRPLLLLLRVLPGDDDAAVATMIGSRIPALGDRVLNALQLSAPGDTSAWYSNDLRTAAVTELHDECARHNFLDVVDFAGSRRLGRILVSATGVVLLLIAILPSITLGPMYRLLHYQEAFAAPAPFTLRVTPGSTELVKGSHVEIIVRAEGGHPKHVTLALRTIGQTVWEEREILLSPSGDYRTELAQVRWTTSYRVTADAVTTDEYVLTVIDRPIVNLLHLSLSPPAYSHLPVKDQDDNVGDVIALRGTMANVAVQSSKPVASAMLVFSDSSEVRLAVQGANAHGRFVVMKEKTYHVLLRDSNDVASSDPIQYAVHLIPDADPTASLVVPGMNLDIADNASLDIAVKIKDDYGFSSLRIGYKLIQSRYEKPAESFSYVPVPLPAGIGTEGLVRYTWQVAKLHLVPEDVVSYFAEVFDNDNISGPKSGVSEIFTLRLPSLDEVFADVDKSHAMSQQALEETMKNLEDAHKQMNELRQDLTAEKNDWQQQKKAEDLLKKYDEMEKKVADVAKTVQDMSKTMEQHQMLSPETLEKYQELQQMMEQLNSPELADAMKKLQQSMQQMTPDQLRQAMQQMTFNEENFRKSVERTLNLLKRIQIEQKLDEAKTRAEQMQKQQEDLAAKTDHASPADRKDIERQQTDMKRQADELRKSLEALQKRMEEFPAEVPLKDMEALNDEMRNGEMEADLNQAEEAMQSGKMDQASEAQKSAAGKMSSTAQKLKKMKDAMQKNQQRQVLNALRRAEQDLLDLSKREEALKDESRSLDPNSQQFRQNAHEQNEVMQDLNNVASRMGELSQKTFAVSPEMGKAMGDAMRSMADAMQSLDQRNGPGATQQQSSAMGSLNESAQHVQEAMQGMMQGGGGGGMGMGALMKRLQQLSGSQQSINDATRNAESLAMQRAAEMGRLAAEQGMVRKSLEELAREAAKSGDGKRVLGDLKRIADEMREVQTDLAQSNVSPETLRKQDRILSRLLDSQKSARERDYEKNRKSSSGTDVARTTPGQLPTEDEKSRLQRALLKAQREGYARDYQELIKKYFDALQQEELQNNH